MLQPLGLHGCREEILVRFGGLRSAGFQPVGFGACWKDGEKQIVLVASTFDLACTNPHRLEACAT